MNLTHFYGPSELADSTGNTNYSYNLDRQIVQTMFSDSSLIKVEYDTAGCGCSGVGKPSKISFDRGTTQFKYDAVGNLAQIISPSIIDTLKYTYDGSLPKSVTWKGAVNGSVGVNYNNDFQVTSQTVNGGNLAAFAYDNDGLLTSAGALAIGRNVSNGILTGTTLGNVTTNYTYNDLGEMTGYTAKYGSNNLFQTAYTYDALGRITTLTETVQGQTKHFDYGYDQTGRLIRVDRNDTTISVYSYDSNGNRLSNTSLSGTNTGTYDAQDRMLAYGNATFGYTATGSLKWKEENGDTTSYDYDLLGNLRSVQLPNGMYIQYLIDGQNRRVAKIVNGSIKKRWLYQNQLNIVAELDSAGNLVSRFVYGTKGHVPDYMVKNGVTYRFITDHLGSVRMVVNTSDGTVAQRLEYDEYGNVLNDANPGFQPFGYAGGLYDSNTGLVRFGARDYDAVVGRWTAKDPINFRGGMNLYVYVSNSPINFIDPSGFVNLLRIAAGVGEVAGGVAIIALTATVAAGTGGTALLGIAGVVHLGLAVAALGVVDIVAGAQDSDVKTPYSILLPGDLTILTTALKIAEDADKNNAIKKKKKKGGSTENCPDDNAVDSNNESMWKIVTPDATYVSRNWDNSW